MVLGAVEAGVGLVRELRFLDAAVGSGQTVPRIGADLHLPFVLDGRVEWLARRVARRTFLPLVYAGALVDELDATRRFPQALQSSLVEATLTDERRQIGHL